METILVVGSTGNIGVAAVIGALRSNRKVLAVVRSQTSADKLIKHVGSSENITFVEADVLSDTGLKGVVDQVKAGKLPSFQHVWASVGGEYVTDPLTSLTTERFRHNQLVSFESNFYAYRDTLPYLLEQKYPKSTWTLCTGAQGDIGTHPLPAMTQGSLFSMSVAAARQNEDTNVRFNEVYLAFRVEVDEDAIAHGVTKASDFGNVYRLLLEDETIRSSRVHSLDPKEDLEKLKHSKKF